MKLKMNYQYTYFIHPFVIKENKYQKYLLSLIKDKKFKLKTFQKSKDIDLYNYFSPKTREFLFSSFSHSRTKLNKLDELPDDTKSAVLSKYPCNIFEYILDEDIQGKAQDKGIFFKIQKIEIICFNTGICFFNMKTNIENSYDFSDLLNFNYKFRDIRQESNLKNYDKIYLQTDTFSNINKLTEFIKDMTGSDIETMKHDIDTQRFLTYSYVCVDSEAWNTNNNFDGIQHDFIKYMNFLSSDNSANLNIYEECVLSEWKYAKMGINKQGVTLFTSSSDINNFIEMPDKFENQYFYTYILNLYKKIYLKKLELEFRNPANTRKVRKRFIEFTKNLWIQDITDDEVGSSINYKLGKILELDRLYYEMKLKYDLLYKELNIEKNSKMSIIIIILLVVLLLVNII
ncbi:MAG: hypothetical protein HFJ60_00865 [Clostridia bacterium]|nr:hypothetical protein [Clostridia bacterium]